MKNHYEPGLNSPELATLLRERETDRQRETERDIDRETERERERDRDRERYRQGERQGEREKDRERGEREGEREIVSRNYVPIYRTSSFNCILNIKTQFHIQLFPILL